MLLIRIINKAFRKNTNRSFYEYNNIEGWLTQEEAKGLHTIANSLPKNATVVEIGSWKGKSTFCIATGLKNGVIHCIDPFNSAGEEGSKEIYEKNQGAESLLSQFRRNLRSIPKSVQIKVHKGYSQDFVGAIPQIDFLFIDGDHSIDGCKYDFENYSHYVNINGLIAFHDFYPERKELGPTWVVENLVKHNSSFKFFCGYDSLQVFQKVK